LELRLQLVGWNSKKRSQCTQIIKGTKIKEVFANSFALSVLVTLLAVLVPTFFSDLSTVPGPFLLIGIATKLLLILLVPINIALIT
jgi:hypothetical protein